MTHIPRTENPDHPVPTSTETADAGIYSHWLREIIQTFKGERGSDVPCGNCIGCCSSSYFIHVNPQDKRALAAIPKKLLFSAPGLAKGNKIMGYDSAGKCPMLVESKCTIYADRPQTCRSYDCRIFAAAGILAGDDTKAVINAKVRSWEFQYPSTQDRELHRATLQAAAFVAEHMEDLIQSRNPTQWAMIAIKVHPLFLAREPVETLKSKIREMLST